MKPVLVKGRPAPRLGPYKALIDQILAADEQAPRKQRHTVAKLYRRLRDEEGYVGGYDQVRRYVAQHRRDHRETFIPLTASQQGIVVRLRWAQIRRRGGSLLHADFQSTWR